MHEIVPWLSSKSWPLEPNSIWGARMLIVLPTKHNVVRPGLLCAEMQEMHREKLTMAACLQQGDSTEDCPTRFDFSVVSCMESR